MAHGKNSRFIVDGSTMTNVAKGLGLTAVKEVADSSVIEGDSHESEAGQQSARLSCQAVFKGSQPNIQAALDSGIASDDLHTVAYAPEGFAPGKVVLFGQTHESQANVSGDNKSVVNVALNYEFTGGLAAGLSLFDPYS